MSFIQPHSLKKNVKNIDNFIHMYDIFGCVHLSLPFIIPSHFYLLFMSFFFFFKKKERPLIFN